MMIVQRGLQSGAGAAGAIAPLPFGDSRARAIRFARSRVSGRKNTLAIWLCLIGLLIPAADAMIYIAGAKFTASRLSIVLLLVPAFIVLSERRRKLVVSDLIVGAAGFWIVLAASQVEGSKISSAFSEALEFTGAYFVARAFIYGPAALREFVRILKIVVLIALLFAIADILTGRLVVHEIVASFFGTDPPDAQYRHGVARAMASLDHAILYGAFCCFAGTIFLYTERDVKKRIFCVGICILGCVLSLSSSGLLAFAIVLAAYAYDTAMHRYPWRWTLFWAMLAVPVIGLFAVSQNPLGWILTHLTLDPESGYFRLMIWEAAIQRLSESPYVGYGFNVLNSEILDATVDSVWLVFGLRFGLPMVALLLLSVFTASMRVKRERLVRGRDPTMDAFATAFTLVLAMYVFIGITVHFWNYMWVFWGLCIGIRASIREWLFSEVAYRAREYRARPRLARAVRFSG